MAAEDLIGGSLTYTAIPTIARKAMPCADSSRHVTSKCQCRARCLIKATNALGAGVSYLEIGGHAKTLFRYSPNSSIFAGSKVSSEAEAVHVIQPLLGVC